MGYLCAKVEVNQYFKHVPHFCVFTRSSGTISLNTGVPSEGTETNLILHPSTEVTTEKILNTLVKSMFIFCSTNNNVGTENW